METEMLELMGAAAATDDDEEEEEDEEEEMEEDWRGIWKDMEGEWR